MLRNTPNCELSDLIMRAASKDSNAFAVLYKRTSTKLYGVIYKIARRQDIAAEALQDTYAKIWLNSSHFNPALGSPLGWMVSIARNHALDMVRSEKKLPLADMPDDWEPSFEFDPLESWERRETLGALLFCLSRLDARKRKMILLAYYQGATRKELSVRFRVPVCTIKTQLRRFLAELKADLDFQRV